MIIFGIFVLLIVLFYLLGKVADLVIYNVRTIGEKLGIKIFFLGILLGFFTTLPELAVGVNAVINNLSSISVGNLLGGIIVLFSLVLGLGAILNRKIISEERNFFNLILVFFYFFLPLILGINGQLGPIKGIILIFSYIFLLYYLYHQQEKENHLSQPLFVWNKGIIRSIFLMILGSTLVVVISNIIIRLTSLLLNQWPIPPFLIGLVLFSLGTNLPEIIIAIRAWRCKIKDLSLSNLIGSGMANIFILGILILIKPISIKAIDSFHSLIFFMFIILGGVLIFHRTNKSLSRGEGIILVLMYLFFVVSQLFFIF